MMRLFFFSVLAGTMIGVMVPTAFAELKENDNIFVKNPDCNISKDSDFGRNNSAVTYIWLW